MNSAFQKMKISLPFNTKTYENLNENMIEHIDQYLFRFAKLQDTIGERLFKSILLFLEEDIEGKPYMDILNKLEKISLLEDKNTWRKLRDIRNEISHQYDDNAEDMAIVLNKIFDAKVDIETIYNKIKDYYIEKNNAK